MTPSDHVRTFIKQINSSAWLIGSRHILYRVQEPLEETNLWTWKNERDGMWYTFSEAPLPFPSVTPLPLEGHVQKIHDAGDASAVFSFGDALILKVRIADKNTRREPHWLGFLADKQLSFEIPEQLFYMEEDGKTFPFEPYIEGDRVNEIWWNLTDDKKDWVTIQVAQVALELLAFQHEAFTAVDHNWMNPLMNPHDNSAEALEKQCTELGMDCSTFVLSHNDLGPTNIILKKDGIAVIDWELAGYVPREWVRTKFGVCGALDVERVQDDSVEIDSEYRKQVEKKLGDMGFPEVTEAYQVMRRGRREEWDKRLR